MGLSANPRRRIGVMGGTFDPIHYGHLVAAEECAAVLGLERVIFVPAAQPPHKLDEPVTAAAHRLAMVALAIADNPQFALSGLELERGGISFTVDTLRALRAAEPDAELSFIVGMDSLGELATWHDPAGILAAAWVAAVHRPGYPPLDLARLERDMPGATARVRIVPIPGLDISSTDLRARFAEGRPVRYLLPESVIQYTVEHHLYQ
jgi:nicotinate-nucleotide adenylyltransferase